MTSICQYKGIHRFEGGKDLTSICQYKGIHGLGGGGGGHDINMSKERDTRVRWREGVDINVPV